MNEKTTTSTKTRRIIGTTIAAAAACMPGSPDKNFLPTYFKKSCVSCKSVLSLSCEAASTRANALKNSALKVCRFQKGLRNFVATNKIMVNHSVGAAVKAHLLQWAFLMSITTCIAKYSGCYVQKIKVLFRSGNTILFVSVCGNRFSVAFNHQ